MQVTIITKWGNPCDAYDTLDHLTLIRTQWCLF